MVPLCQDKKNSAKIAVIGGGPAGIYCALNILKLFLIEANRNFHNYKCLLRKDVNNEINQKVLFLYLQVFVLLEKIEILVY
jgi:flavin-dependent dehydrogenase